MGAHVQCPKCEQAYALSDEQALLYAGREFECTQCNARFLVPRNSAKSAGSIPLRGELPREQVTAGAMPSAAGVPTFITPFSLTGAPTAAYTHPAYEPDPGSKLATASLICALIGLFIPFVPAIVAIVLGIIALVRIHRGKAEGASLASGGIALGCAGLVIGSGIFYQRVMPIIEAVI